jgi:hypothetical protein
LARAHKRRWFGVRGILGKPYLGEDDIIRFEDVYNRN